MTLPDPPPLPNLAALFLDFDGTLVELADTPDAVQTAPDLLAMLDRLAHRLEGRLAIVSGRSVRELREKLGIGTFAIAGSHGQEISLAPGETQAPERDPGIDLAEAELRSFAEGRSGVLVESKPFGVGLHYRQANQDAEACRAIADRLAKRHGLAIQHGKMVAELRGPIEKDAPSDKGGAIRAFMQDASFKGATPVFIGDDVTDEDGFKAVLEMGGHPILVGDRQPSIARYRLASVAAVHSWLAAQLGRDPG